MGDIWIQDCDYCHGIHTNKWAYDECIERNSREGRDRSQVIDEARRATPAVDKPEPYN